MRPMDKDDEEFFDDLLKYLGHLNDGGKARVIRDYIKLLNPGLSEDEIKKFLRSRNLPTMP